MKIHKKLMGLISVVLLMYVISFPVYASDVSSGTFKVIVDHHDDNGSLRYQAAGLSYSSKPGSLYFYFIPSEDGKYYSAYIVSDSGFSLTFCNSGLYPKKPDFSSIDTKKIVGKVNLSNGYYVSSAFSFYRFTSDEYSYDGDLLPVIYWSSSELPWEKDGFELGKEESGGGGTTSSIIYDSSIPAPENLTFTEKRGSGLDGLLWKDVQHILHWTNAFTTSPPMVRISVLYDKFDAVDPDKLIDYTYPLVSFSDSMSASLKTYSYDFADWRDNKIDNNLFSKINEYRVQFFVIQDGTYRVGPVSTIHVNRNALGKYTGSTVTVEYPSDPDNLGNGGDNLYDSSWGTDADNVKDYDTDGNLVGTGSGDKNTIQNLIDGLLNIPTVISQFFSSLSSMMSGIGGLPAILSQLFSFLPVEVVSIIALGFIIIVVLRIFGR